MPPKAGFSSSGFGGDVEECIGGSVIDSLGEDEAQMMADTDPIWASPDQVDGAGSPCSTTASG